MWNVWRILLLLFFYVCLIKMIRETLSHSVCVGGGKESGEKKSVLLFSGGVWDVIMWLVL